MEVELDSESAKSSAPLILLEIHLAKPSNVEFNLISQYADTLYLLWVAPSTTSVLNGVTSCHAPATNSCTTPSTTVKLIL